MTKIDSVGWGNVVIDGQKFDQVVISGEKVIRREVEKLEKLFGTTHVVADWEQKLLMEGNPEIIILSSGQGGVMEISQEVKEKLAKPGAEMKSPRPWKGEVSSLRGKNPPLADRLRFLLHSSPPMERRGILKREIKVLLTPQAVSEFNRLTSEGKKVNALIHTTC